MDKKQKYYNYIVDDLVKNSEIIYSPRNTIFNKATLPFIEDEHIPLRDLKYLLDSPIPSTFVDYVIEMYGAQDTANDNDVYPLWKMYSKRMIMKIG